jgi:hypothetical protein
MRYLKISRISFILGFALSAKIELLGLQFITLYEFSDLLTRPISLVLLLCIVAVIVKGLFFNSGSKIKYV